AHLTIRNDYLRKIFGAAFEGIFTKATDLFADEASVRKLFGVEEPAPSAAVKRFMDENLSKLPPNSVPVPPRVLYQIAQMILKEGVSSNFSEQKPAFVGAIMTMVAAAPQLVRDGHNRALSSGF